MKNSTTNVFIVQAQNAFNDNAVKFTIMGLALALASGTALGDSIQHILSGLLAVPFILLAPLAGYLSDRYSKRSVMIGCSIAQLFIFVWIAVAVYMGDIPWVIAGFGMLSVQSTIFSPAKMGILKELVGSEKLASINGIMQMGTMLAILAGMWLGGQWFDARLAADPEHPIHAALLPIIVIGAISIIPLILSFRLKRTPAHPDVPFRTGILFSHFADIRHIFDKRPLRLTSIGVAFYWFIAYFLGTVIVGFGLELFPDTSVGGASGASAEMTVLIGIGLIFGSVCVSALSKQGTELGMVPLGGAGIGIAFLMIGLAPAGSGFFRLGLGTVGFASAFWLIPLQAHLQDLASERERGRILAGVNLLDSLVGLSAVGLDFGLKAAGLTAGQRTLCLLPVIIVATLYVARLQHQNVIRFVTQGLLRLVYSIKTTGLEKLPHHSQGALLLPNHISYVDALILCAAIPRQIRFVIYDHFMAVKWLAPGLRFFNVIPIDIKNSKDAIRATNEALAAGHTVCIFPEGQLTRTGFLHEILRGYQLMARKAEAPIYPVYMDGVWGSIFSFAGGRFFKKTPRQIPYRVSVQIGDALTPAEATPKAVRESLTSLSAKALSERPAIDQTLASALVHSLRQKPWQHILENGATGEHYRAATLLSIAAALGERWSDDGEAPLQGNRIAILLAPSPGAILAHLGVLLAGKTPIAVPLDNPVGPDAMADILTDHQITSLIGAPLLQDALADSHAFPEHVIDFASELKSLPPENVFKRLLATVFAPKILIPKNKTPDEETVGYLNLTQPPTLSLKEAPPAHTLITLTSRQFLANQAQIGDTNTFLPGDRLFSRAPLASAPGLAFTLFGPLLHRIYSITLPLKAEPEEISALNPTVLIDAGDLDMDTAPRLHLVFGSHITDEDAPHRLPGLAHGSTGIILALSQPHPPTPTDTAKDQFGHAQDSRGHLLQGFAVTTENPTEPPLKISGAPLCGETLLPATEDKSGFIYLQT